MATANSTADDVAPWLAGQGVAAKIQDKVVTEGVNGPCMSIVASDHDHTALAELGIGSQIIGNCQFPSTNQLPAAEVDTATYEKHLEVPLLQDRQEGLTDPNVTIQDEGREVFHTAREFSEGSAGSESCRSSCRSCRCGINTTRLFAVVAVAIALVDLPVDTIFIVKLADKQDLRHDFAAACGMLAAAVLANLMILLHFVHRESVDNTDFKQWLQENQTCVMPMFFLSLFKFDCMRLLCTKIFGMQAFSAPLSVASQQRLVWYGVVGTVMEGLPQLIITAHVHHIQGHLSTVVLAMLVVNSCSLLYTILSRLVVGVLYSKDHQDRHQRHKTRCSRLFAAAPDMLLSMLMVTGVAVVVTLLLHHHPFAPQSACVGSSADLLVSECDAFGILHDATNGKQWNECRERSMPCNCSKRVMCVTGHITALDLSANNLEGTLPAGVLPKMGRLTSLQLNDNWRYWKIDDNWPTPGPTPPITQGLKGQVPSDIMLLTSLVELNLSTTELKGDLKLFSKMTDLTSLDLSTLGWTDIGGQGADGGCDDGLLDPDDEGLNVVTLHFSGSLDTLKHLTQLHTLRLHGSMSTNGGHYGCIGWRINSVSGSASALVQLRHLTSFTLANAGYSPCNGDYNATIAVGNRVKGELPLWMLRDSEHLTVDIDGNDIMLPHNIGDLQASSLSTLNVGGWRFNGTLPLSLGALTSLRRLNLSYSNFSGSIGPLSTLMQLTSLDVSGGYDEFEYYNFRGRNSFSGELPLWMLHKNLTGQMEVRLHQEYDDDNRIGLPHDIGSLDGTFINNELDLSSQGLGGSLPASLGNLMSLRRLNLASNGFSGSIAVLSTLIHLTSLDVSSNRLNDSISPLSTLVQLTSMDASSNSFSGELPLWMLRKNLTSQMELRLGGYSYNDNRIGLPHDIGCLNGSTAINDDELDLSNQGLGGLLPASFGNLTSLRRLNLCSNHFSGSIIALSTLVHLTSLDISCNGLHSSINPLSTLVQLTSLDVSSENTNTWQCVGRDQCNAFNGELPLWMLRKKLTSHMELRLHHSNDYNSIGLPPDIGSLGGTVIYDELDLSNQGLGGPLPTSLGDLTSLRHLDLASNNFSGELPLSLLRKNLTGQMELLRLAGGNNRIGLPHDIGCLNGSTAINDELDLSSQGLGGPLPASLGNLTSLRRLNLCYNRFSGSIGLFSTLTGLEELGIGCLSFKGDVPDSEIPLAGCGGIHGRFTMLSRLTNLRSLDLSGQRVKGPLEPLSGLTQLTSLVLAYSRATTDTIPASFTRLSRLTTLRLQCSNLTGKVPALAVFARTWRPRQCELSEYKNNCDDFTNQTNRFSCPLPAGAASNCSGRCIEEDG
jgi:Leucine-rich repeat (LRR) protein